MNRFPPSLDTDSPHSLHSPFLHFDLITSPPPSFLSFFSFSSISSTILRDSLRSILDLSLIRHLSTLFPFSGKTELWELLVRSPRERAIFGTSANLENAFQLHARRSPDTSYLYDQEFRATPHLFSQNNSITFSLYF